MSQRHSDAALALTGGVPVRQGPVGKPAVRARNQVSELARRIVGDPEVIERYRNLARAGKLPPPIFIELLHYAYGKPRDEDQSSVNPATQLIQVVVQTGGKDARSETHKG